MPVTAVFHDEHRFRVGETEFHCSFENEAPAEALAVMKTRPMVEAYLDLFRTMAVPHIVELGIRRGGSTALLAAMAEPRTLVAIELVPTPAPALSAYIEARGIGDRVRPHYGVDQADRERVSAIVKQEMGENALDLVVDDASHLYEPTVASFETLFPLIRPGGLFIIEDWLVGHHLHAAVERRLEDLGEHNLTPEQKEALAAMRAEQANGVRKPPPLSRLVLELVLAKAESRDAVARVEVDEYFTVVHRGPARLDPETFRVADLYHDRYQLLTPLT